MSTLVKVKALSDPEIQTWLKRVEKSGVSMLIYAMLGADAEVCDCIFRNMSKHAGSRLKAEIAEHKKKRISITVINQYASQLEKLF